MCGGGGGGGWKFPDWSFGGGSSRFNPWDSFDLTGQRAAQNAASDATNKANEQAAQAAQVEQQLALQPKQTPSDNFLATKNRMIQNMRLGLLANIGSGGGLSAATLSAPSLTGSNPGKAKLGQ